MTVRAVMKVEQGDNIGSKGRKKKFRIQTTTRHRIYMALDEINIILK